MKIAITGSSGLVGSALLQILIAAGHDVVPLKRPRDWNPDQGTVNLSALSGVEAMIHLAGENVASGRWTAARKQSFLDSRIKGTRLISETISRMEKPPKALVSAS